MILSYKKYLGNNKYAKKKSNYKVIRGTRILVRRPPNTKTFQNYKKLGIYVNSIYVLQAWANKRICFEGKTVKNGEKTVETIWLDEKDFQKIFRLGWAVTCHSVQGKSIDEDITIYQYNSMLRYDKSILYTATSRPTDWKYLNLGCPGADSDCPGPHSECPRLHSECPKLHSELRSDSPKSFLYRGDDQPHKQ